MIEVVLFIFHVCGFVAVLAPLLVLSKKSSSQAVWTEFFNSGWDSYGTSTLVGLIANVIPMLGADAAAHMSGLSAMGRTMRVLRQHLLTYVQQRNCKMPRTPFHAQ